MELEKITEEPIYSEPRIIMGYKMRLLVYLNEINGHGNHLSIYFQLMKGHLDECLHCWVLQFHGTLEAPSKRRHRFLSGNCLGKRRRAFSPGESQIRKSIWGGNCFFSCIYRMHTHILHARLFNTFTMWQVGCPKGRAQVLRRNRGQWPFKAPWLSSPMLSGVW